MHESRMIAEVVPPGLWAIENVRGSNIATPFAPPRPGKTPMITPRMTPANMRTRFFSDSAIAKPCSSEFSSSMSIQPQGRLKGPLGQRDLEPDLEHEEENHAVA